MIRVGGKCYLWVSGRQQRLSTSPDSPGTHRWHLSGKVVVGECIVRPGGRLKRRRRALEHLGSAGWDQRGTRGGRNRFSKQASCAVLISGTAISLLRTSASSPGTCQRSVFVT